MTDRHSDTKIGPGHLGPIKNVMPGYHKKCTIKNAMPGNNKKMPRGNNKKNAMPGIIKK